jgi:hypothetical protein
MRKARKKMKRFVPGKASRPGQVMIRIIKLPFKLSIMESRRISDNFQELKTNVTEYIRLNVDLLKVNSTEKLAKLASFLLLLSLFFILVLIIVFFASIAFILWYGKETGSAYVGALIVTGAYFLIAMFAYMLRKRLFIIPITREISKIIMEDTDANEQ